ncbi:MAG TPA: diaminopimelate decarboxylase [Trueperaceae bacterium]|nr:diaminopimelate decarboxylase [Trueperaceae bacterium]
MTDELLTAVANVHGTPTYVYDLDTVTARFRQVQDAFPGTRVHYAVKANALGPLLAHLAALGARAEALTAGELARALRAGFAPEHVVLGGPGHGVDLARWAGDVGVGLVSLDSVGAWRVWRSVEAPGTRFLVRLNPGFDPRTHEHLATGAAESKFGMPASEALEVAREVAATGKLAGFHVHAGSMISDAEVARLVTEALEPHYADMPGLELVDFGGGFAVPATDLQAFGEPLLQFARRHEVTPIIEPGRFLVAESGVLLTRVLHVKEAGPRRHVIADAGMADLLRPALYGAQHPVRVVGEDGRQRGTVLGADLDGPLCENADRLARDVDLQGVDHGALLAVGVAGAYGYAMASNYASSLRPAQVVAADGSFSLAARREDPSDLWRLEAPVAGGLHALLDPGSDEVDTGGDAAGSSARAAVAGLLASMVTPVRAAAALINSAAENLRPRLGRLEDLTRAFSNELYRPLLGVGPDAIADLDQRIADHGQVARATVRTPAGDFLISLTRERSASGSWRVTGLARDLPDA